MTFHNIRQNIKFSLILVISLVVIEKCLSQVFQQPVKVDENILIPRVVSGFPAKLGDVPYQVGFKKLQSGTHYLYRTFCGGVIIAPNKLLSAAHCFDINKSEREKNSTIVPGYHLTRKYAVAGSLMNKQVYRTDNSKDGQWRKLKEVVYPSDYIFPRNDICIVFITHPFNFSDYINSIPFTSKYKDYKGECLTSGYGKLNKPFSEKKLNSDILMLANLAIIPAYWCSKKHGKNMRHFICTSDKLTDVGKGDSGGPLVCANTGDPNDKGKGVVVGIVSGNKLYAGSFFTRVSSFYNYIERNNADDFSLTTYMYLCTAIYCGFDLFCLRFIAVFSSNSIDCFCR